MATLTCLGSSSAGNCYLLSDDTETLILELGVKLSHIKQALNFDLSKVVASIISHCHGDHSSAVKDAIKAGIDVYMSKGTQEALNIKSHRITAIAHGKKFKVGNFEIMPFNTDHNCPEPLGFIIKNPSFGQLVFITDSKLVEFTFPGTNHFLVEANFCDQIINDRQICGSLNPAQANRTVNSHMSLITCKQLLLANDLTKVANIILIHLSPANSDAKRFKREIEEATNCNVEVASKGMVRELLTTPF